MKPNKHELTLKVYIKAEKELRKVYEQLWALPKTPIKEPYQHGWDLIVDLREDYNKEKTPIVKGLITKFATNSWTRNAKHVSSIRKKPSISDVNALSRSKFFLSGYNLGVRSITQKEYDKLSVQEKKYFTYWEPLFAKHQPWHFNLPRHYLVVRIKKHIVTHKQEIDPQLLKRKDELSKILEPYYRKKNGCDSWDHYFNNRKERRRSKVKLSQLDLE